MAFWQSSEVHLREALEIRYRRLRIWSCVPEQQEQAELAAAARREISRFFSPDVVCLVFLCPLPKKLLKILRIPNEKLIIPLGIPSRNHLGLVQKNRYNEKKGYRRVSS